MKHHPRSMTLFQLKQAIEYNKKRITITEHSMVRMEKNSDAWKSHHKKLINYRSALKVCEFTLQRKIDLFNLPDVKKHIKARHKNLISYLEAILKSKWNESNWNNLEKQCREFIQNYNEL